MSDKDLGTALEMCGEGLNKIALQVKAHEHMLDSSRQKLQFTKWVSAFLCILVIGLNLYQGHWLIAASFAIITVSFFMVILFQHKFTVLFVEWLSLTMDKERMRQTFFDFSTERNLRDLIKERNEDT